MTDRFGSYRPGLSSPGDEVVAVTPNDGADLTNGVCRSFECAVAGDVTFVDRHGNPVLVYCSAGQVKPYRAARIMATGTTATGIVAAY